MSSTDMAAQKMITLMSSDGEAFEVETAVALEARTLQHMIEDKCADNSIPVHNVTSKILAKVLEYCKRHVDAAAKAKRGRRSRKGCIPAANYLEIKNLLDLTCQTVADMIKGKTPEEIRKTFNIRNDFTADEEEEVRRENTWAFE
ncbi:hypothetical protein DH2020_045384 [Rehmannia glutinosa]|uniref:SKP1-like protein n=1 Tax=Rehmannia glutinosa TaxID=99300 RepID=A0ABR0UF77_REHGL